MLVLKTKICWIQDGRRQRCSLKGCIVSPETPKKVLKTQGVLGWLMLDTWTGGVCEGSVCTALKELQVWKNCQIIRWRSGGWASLPLREWLVMDIRWHPHPPTATACRTEGKTSCLPSSVCLLLSLKSWWSASLVLINHELKKQNKTFSFHNFHGSVAMGGVFVWLLVMDKLHSSRLLQSWPARWRTPNMLVFNDTAVRESVGI